MSGYIYTVTEGDSQLGDDEQVRLLTTRKYEATRFLETQLMAGKSMAKFQVTRSRDGRPDTSVWVDTYDFMKIDLGEE